ncbi:hypothetical protein CEXT_432331 [Caerostris extrusa]|uniref:Uncharacterized protein n=1 Tax=Caerostris extrusa TaxID=172846 RepID=A0AAV4QEX1_CAEEX|nr:hypothetical protein CEXT_432331 [Caerostris extrusa]
MGHVLAHLLAVGGGHRVRGVDPAESVDDGLRHLAGVDAFDGLSHELLRGDDDAEGDEEDHGDSVVESEHVVVDMDPADFQQAFKTPQHVEHAVARRGVARVGPEPLASPPSPRGSQGPRVRGLAYNGAGWGRPEGKGLGKAAERLESRLLTTPSLYLHPRERTSRRSRAPGTPPPSETELPSGSVLQGRKRPKLFEQAVQQVGPIAAVFTFNFLLMYHGAFSSSISGVTNQAVASKISSAGPLVYVHPCKAANPPCSWRSPEAKCKGVRTFKRRFSPAPHVMCAPTPSTRRPPMRFSVSTGRFDFIVCYFFRMAV